MKNNSNRQRSFLYLIAFLFIGLLTGYLIYSIDELQHQVYERDDIISEMNERDSMRRDEYNALISSLNRLLGDAEIEEDGTFDVHKFIEKHNSLKDTIGQLRSRIDLIRKNYGIVAKTSRRYTDDNRVITTTYIESSDKVDSALILLPYFRDRLVINEDDTWTINLTGEEYGKVKDKYEEYLFKYNELANKYNRLLDQYNNLIEDNDKRVKFFENLLSKMATKGVVEIDTVGDEISYKF